MQAPRAFLVIAPGTRIDNVPEGVRTVPSTAFPVPDGGAIIISGSTRRVFQNAGEAVEYLNANNDGDNDDDSEHSESGADS